MSAATAGSLQEVKRVAVRLSLSIRLELVLPLLVGLFHCWIYVFLVPPWQHYDEPGHFEYAWLIANRSELPKPGDFDQEMRREVAASMIEHDFGRYTKTNYAPNLLQSGPIYTAIPQIDGAFGYYWLLAMPLRVMRESDITLQLYVARLVSLLLLLVTIAAAWGFTSELTRPGNNLRLLVPLVVAMVPGVVELMSGLNNDVGAAAASSLLFWGISRVLRSGISVTRLAWLACMSVACLLVKATTLPVVCAAVAAIPLALFRRKQRKFVWILYAFLLISVVGLSFGWGDSSAWIRMGNQTTPTQGQLSGAPLGSHALRLAPSSSSGVFAVNQMLPIELVTSLRNKTLTFGAYVWSAEEGAAVPPPVISFHGAGRATPSTWRVTTQPTFQAFTFTVPANATRVSLWLYSAEARDEEFPIYYDGVVIADGDHTRTTPEFSDVSGSNGVWDGVSFTNLIRNGSSQTAKPYIRSELNAFLLQFLNVQPNVVLGMLVDAPISRIYFEPTLIALSETFWARLGWGRVRFQQEGVYQLLNVFLLMGFMGAAFALIHERRRVPWETVIVCGFATSIVWFACLVRGVDFVYGEGGLWLPGSRYALPVVVPTVLFLVAGWRTAGQMGIMTFGLVWQLTEVRRDHLRLVAIVLFGSVFVFLDLYALFTSLNFYR